LGETLLQLCCFIFYAGTFRVSHVSTERLKHDGFPPKVSWHHYTCVYYRQSFSHGPTWQNLDSSRSERSSKIGCSTALVWRLFTRHGLTLQLNIIQRRRACWSQSLVGCMLIGI